PDPDLPSFPTRRSSDLRGGGAVAHQIGRLAAGGELEAYRVDDHVARPHAVAQGASLGEGVPVGRLAVDLGLVGPGAGAGVAGDQDRKSTRLNSSHVKIS